MRKRVIKLLKSYYSITSNIDVRIDICTRLVLRMLDEDETVKVGSDGTCPANDSQSLKDLATKSLEELWFSVPQASAIKIKTQSSSTSTESKAQLLAKVSVIMGVSGSFRDRQSPLEDVLHKIVSNAENVDALDLKG